MEAINRSADEAAEDSEEILNELILLLEKRRSDVKQQIRFKQEGEVILAKELQQEVEELRRKDAELQELSHTDDHARFLNKYPSTSCLSESTKGPRGTRTGSPSTQTRPLRYFEAVTASVSAVRDKLQLILKDQWCQISETEPKTRADFLEYSRAMTLDPNTAHKWLVLSEGNKKITMNRESTLHTTHPDNFIHICQVLNTESLSGRRYWEMERSGRVAAAVSYRNIGKSGGLTDCGFGYNEKAWALHCDKTYIFRHNNASTCISGPTSRRVGVYLDVSAGLLSFYSVSENMTMTLLHRVQTAFTQPVYAGLGLYGSDGDTAELK